MRSLRQPDGFRDERTVPGLDGIVRNNEGIAIIYWQGYSTSGGGFYLTL